MQKDDLSVARKNQGIGALTSTERLTWLVPASTMATVTLCLSVSSGQPLGHHAHEMRGQDLRPDPG
jgi:hypothetical protein